MTAEKKNNHDDDMQSLIIIMIITAAHKKYKAYVRKAIVCKKKQPALFLINTETEPIKS